MRKRRHGRFRPDQNTFCRGYRCREMCKAAKRWCRRCWADLPEARRQNIVDCASFLATHPGDEEATTALKAAELDADRALVELRRGLA